MARTTSIPAYRLHRQSGQAIVTLRNPDGMRKDYLLGPHNSAESKAEYLRLVTEWQVSGQRIPGAAKHDLTINELILAFWAHVERHYRHPDGTPTNEVENFRHALKTIRQLYGSTLARDFGPLALKAVRQAMIASGLSRRVINARISRIRMMFRWAASEELLPADVLVALKTVAGLHAGRTEAKELDPVKPVDVGVVEATAKHLSPTVAAMVQVQLLTGMRPGEVCSLKLADIDRSGPVWLYKPAHHKTAWRGKARVIGLGPKAQAILQPFLNADPNAFLFSPRAVVEQQQAARTAKRQTPRYPSHMRRNATKRKKAPERTPADCYTSKSYCRAIARACDLAFPPPDELAQRPGETLDAWRGRLTPEQRQQLATWRAKHRWHPNQLRHAFATEVRKRFGLDGAQVVLGHSKANVTEVYAELNEDHIATIAAAIG